ncbi:MAG TPA: ABC transporter permease [Solirubrobacteraceae bacterium]
MSVTELGETHSYGPNAFGDDLRRFWNLTVTLAVTDYKLTYFGSVLGYVWSLMRPLLFFGVLYGVFTFIFQVGKGVPNYSVELLVAIILWTFFLQATAGCVQCMLAREGMLRKMRFPRLVIPLAVTLTALFQLTTNLIPIFALALGSGIMPRWSWLEIVPLVLLLAILALGIGMILSVLYVRFRDIQPIWDITAQILFYAAPIIYPIFLYNHSVKTYRNAAGQLCPNYPNVPCTNNFTLHTVGRIAMANPIATIIAQARHALVGGLDSVNPSASFALGGPTMVLIPLGIIVAVFMLGLWVFNREAPRISENL